MEVIMKKIYFAMIILIFCPILCTFAHILPKKPIPAEKLYIYAEEVSQSEKITSVGVAAKQLSPDYAKIFAVYDCREDEIQTTIRNEYKTILSELYSSGVNEEDITLRHFSSHLCLNFSNDSNCQYFSRYHFLINVCDLEKLHDITDKLNQNNVRIEDIKYYVSNLDQEYSNVLDMAIEDAKNKAATTSSNQDLHVTEIKEKSVVYSSTFYSSDFEDSQSAIELKGIVCVEFE